MADLDSGKPAPKITPVVRPFWEAAKRSELVVQKCEVCKFVQFYPKPICANCGSEKLGWIRTEGRGNLYSYTVPRRVIDNSETFAPELPFVVGIVELDEGPRMYTNIVQCEIDKVQIGMRVEVVFEDYSNGIKLPKFRPI